MKLWLLRHARLECPDGLCYGASDLPANALDTRRAAQALAQLLPAQAPVWVSGLARTRQLAREIQRLRPDLGLPRADTRLNEMNFGCWELQAWSAIPRAALDDWLADFGQHRFGGVESAQQVIDRVGAALAELQSGQLQQAVWITHAGVIRAVQYLLAARGAPLRAASQWPRDAPAPGAFVCLQI
ncbi:histidine phosphatase family protein [Hydrogenophaga sp.]|uniref:histidine phosphatase family protein n=1 Tax=Hydrogenophaga sp. TaxID=1904254 RepID=UPI001986A22B|nr:histidine phosphatase family protein [Hydrogenophaga sp.]MBD3893679.1 phosphoglycerate kinase [Hydrogenophaga sp.]